MGNTIVYGQQLVKLINEKYNVPISLIIILSFLTLFTLTIFLSLIVLFFFDFITSKLFPKKMKSQ